MRTGRRHDIAGAPDTGAITMAKLRRIPWRDRGTGIRDYDLMYFDDSDPSWGGRGQSYPRCRCRDARLRWPVEVRNRSRHRGSARVR
jgi:hypothetical protein